MALPTWSTFANIYVVDFEFSAPDGESPRPICCVARNLRSGELLRLWEDELMPGCPPYRLDSESLFVAYYASAELGCHLALDWPMPAWTLDLYIEFKRLVNGTAPPCGYSLLGAGQYFGLPILDVDEKQTMRALALRGGPWTSAERVALLDYCQSDVDALALLFERMRPALDLSRALWRGQYMAACARMERVGIPIDVSILDTLRQSWDQLKAALIAKVDVRYQVFEAETFKADRFEQYLAAHGIPWERTDTGRLKLDDQTFKERSRCFPALDALRELRVSLAQLRLTDLAVGQDGRNRTLLSGYRAKTSRNAPSTSKFIFGPSTWLRHLIRPDVGTGLAYIDWSQQEFGIAAALSGDPRMIDAYESGDPYLAFAKQAGAVPAEATKMSHSTVREQFKSCVLAVQYGMGSETFARRIGQTPAHAAQLLELHHRTYPVFWRWIDGVLSYALLMNRIHSVFGWVLQLDAHLNPRTLQNYPMQTNGAEMLRAACCRITETGIRVCAPVHDALLIEAPLEQFDETIVAVQTAMAAASRLVLGSLTLRSSVTRILPPSRFTDPRGAEMWRTVLDVLPEPAGVRA